MLLCDGYNTGHGVRSCGPACVERGGDPKFHRLERDRLQVCMMAVGPLWRDPDPVAPRVRVFGARRAKAQQAPLGYTLGTRLALEIEGLEEGLGSQFIHCR
jgi:hypothetical protein